MILFFRSTAAIQIATLEASIVKRFGRSPIMPPQNPIGRPASEAPVTIKDTVTAVRT